MPASVPYRVGDEPVPGFRLLEFLGRGGFGEVWRCSAPGGTEIALKLIPLGDETALKELRSLKLVKLLRHPNLVPIVAYWIKDDQGRLLDEASVAAIDAGPEATDTVRWSQTPGGASPSPSPKPPQPAELIIAMGLGEMNLSQRLRQCQEAGVYGLPDQELLTHLSDAARAIDYLNRPIHDLGEGPASIQHCDIKPHNLLVVGGALQVCDFGLARMLGDVRTTSAAAGTIAYAAPECFVDGKPSTATDQYSLAITYYELKSGTLPYDVKSAAQIGHAVIKGQLTFLRVSLPEQQVLRRATALDPRQRFATCVEMVQALAEAAAAAPSTSATTLLRLPQPRTNRRPLWAAGLLMLLLAGGLVVWQSPWTRRQAASPPETVVAPLAQAPSHSPPAGDAHSGPPANESAAAEASEARPDEMPTTTAGPVDEIQAAEPGDTPAAPPSRSEQTQQPPQPHSVSPAPEAPPAAGPSSPPDGAPLVNSLGMKLLLLPAAAFWMGTDETAASLAEAFAPLPSGFDNADEQPRHLVQIEQPFYLGDSEVTVGQFRQFVEEADYRTEAERDGRGGWGYDPESKTAGADPRFNWRDSGIPQNDDSPVVNVSWNDAQAFCAWLSQREGMRYRLPTEAEWEYACRAGSETRFSSGDSADDLHRVANVLDLTTLEQLPGLGAKPAGLDGWAFAAPVGSLPANAFGLRDMHGNVAEWCGDWYNRRYDADAPRTSPTGPEEGTYRVLRGGSWIHPPIRCRSAYRGFESPDFRSGYVGFRVACEP